MFSEQMWSDEAFVGFPWAAKGPRKARREGGFQVKEYWAYVLSYTSMEYLVLGGVGGSNIRRRGLSF